MAKSLTNKRKDDGKTSEMGIIVHWGWYAVPAFDDVAQAKRRTIMNGSEWAAKRLMDGERATTDYCRQSEWKTTDYKKFGRHFCVPNHWNPDDWVQLFKRAGATYAILTAKHHDGVCLWPTKTAGTKAHPSIDFVGGFRDACRKHGLRFGLYYSWMEFARTPTREYLDTIVRRQVRELIAYKPEIVFWDGDWPMKSQYAQQTMDDCLAMMRFHLPDISFNDRIGHRAERKDPNWTLPNMYRSYADRTIPDRKPTVEWESIHTLGLSWGYNRMQQPSDYKTADQIRALRERVAQLGGNFLLNVGPRADGTLDPNEQALLDQLATL